MKEKGWIFVLVYATVILTIGGLGALGVNWFIGFFVDWPITLKNWLLTWGAMILFRLVTSGGK